MTERQKKNEELKKAYRKLEEASLTDPLTGLWNRRFLEQHLDGDVALTRSSADAPEIDGVVRVEGGAKLKAGAFAQVVVTDADAHDLTARLAQ